VKTVERRERRIIMGQVTRKEEKNKKGETRKKKTKGDYWMMNGLSWLRR